MKCLSWLFASLYIILFVSSCADKGTRKNSINLESDSEIILDKLKAKEAVVFSDIIDNYKIIPLETNEECALGRISKIQFYKDRIFVLDWYSTKSLYVFSLSGEFIHQIGKKGTGPGEFLDPRDFTINTNLNEIIILDAGKKQLLFYTLSGDYIRSTGISYLAVGVMYCNTNLLVFKGAAREDNLIFSDKNGVMVNSLFPFENRNESMIIPNTFQSFHDSIILFRLFSRDTIYRIANNNVLYYRTLKYNKENNSSLMDEPGYGFVIGSYIESGKHIFISINKFKPEKEAYSVFITKETGNQYYFKWGSFQNNIFFHNSFLEVGTTTQNDELVFIVQPHNLIKSYELYHDMQPIDNMMLETINQIDETSNPLLVVAKIKEF